MGNRIEIGSVVVTCKVVIGNRAALLTATVLEISEERGSRWVKVRTEGNRIVYRDRKQLMVIG